MTATHHSGNTSHHTNVSPDMTTPTNESSRRPSVARSLMCPHLTVRASSTAMPAKTVTAALSVASSSSELPHPQRWLKQNRAVIAAAAVTPFVSSRQLPSTHCVSGARRVSCSGPCCLPFDHHSAAVPSDAELQAFGALLYRQLKSREALMHMFTCGCLQDHLEMRTRAMEQRNAAATLQPSPTPISPASTEQALTPLPSPVPSPSKPKNRRALPDKSEDEEPKSARQVKRASAAPSAPKTKKRRMAPSVKTKRSLLVPAVSQVDIPVRAEVPSPTRTVRRKAAQTTAAHRRSHSAQSISVAAIAIPSLSIASVDGDASLYSSLPVVMSTMSTMPSLNEVPSIDDEHVSTHVDEAHKKPSSSRRRRDSLSDLVESDDALIHDFLVDSNDAAVAARKFNYGPDSPSTAFTSDSGMSSPSDDSPLLSLGRHRDDDDTYHSPPFTTHSSSTWHEHNLNMMHDIELNML